MTNSNDVSSKNLYIALLHHPVYNKQGDVVTTAITNFDLHDIARAGKTFDVGGYYVVNPMAAQRELAGRIISHWTLGFGSEYNPNRGEALGVIKVVGELDEARTDIAARHGGKSPRLIVTAAKGSERAIGYPEAREIIKSGPHILAFGTGWGLTREFIDGADFVLKPIEGISGYNHLPVRSAAAIILDRLLSNS